MSEDKIEVNMNIYDIPIVVEQLEKENKEIERLNNIINQIKDCVDNAYSEKEYSGAIIDIDSIIKELKGVDKE